MPRQPKIDWAKVDWTQTDTEISNSTGICPSRVGRARKTLAPRTFSDGKRGRPALFTGVDWSKVDLSRPTAEIARELGVSQTGVRRQKQKLARTAPKTEAEWCACRIKLSCEVARSIIAREVITPHPLTAVEYAIFNMLKAIEELGNLFLTETKQKP